MSASAIHPAVRQMIDHPGIYICTTYGNPKHAIVIVWQDSELIVMEKDFALDPTRFADDIKISHGPLKP